MGDLGMVLMAAIMTGTFAALRGGRCGALWAGFQYLIAWIIALTLKNPRRTGCFWPDQDGALTAQPQDAARRLPQNNHGPPTMLWQQVVQVEHAADMRAWMGLRHGFARV